MTGTPITSTTDILKVDATLGVVFGYAIVCREKDGAGNWVDHFDTQGHHIPEDEMLKASVDFAQHTGEARAETIAKALVDALSKHSSIDEDGMTELVKRASKDMHEGDDIQEVVMLLPVTEELAKALNWDIQKTGLVIGLKPTADVLEMYKKGERTGFSMGGTGVLLEEAA
jgi:hypothetical protein